MRDAKIMRIYEGTNQIQRVIMARELLGGSFSAAPEDGSGWPAFALPVGCRHSSPWVVRTSLIDPI